MRIRLSKWAERNYVAGSIPNVCTLRKMAKRGDIAGAFQDKANNWWVELEAMPRASDVKSEIDSIVGDDEILQRAIS